MTEKSIQSKQEIVSKDGTTYFVGQRFIDRDGRYLRIYKIDDEKVYYERSYDGGTEWSHYGSDYVDYMHKKHLISVDESYQDLERRALDVLLHMDEYQDDDDKDQPNDTTAIIQSTTKDAAERALEAINERRQIVELARRMIEKKTEQMGYIVRRMEEKMGRIRKIINIFELYLGIYEEIIQIQEGTPASASTPIGIRQLVLYMDEEVGDPRERNGQKGIDWRSVDDFDSWLLKDNHWEVVAPEEKCIVALKPSRQNRWYSSDPWFDSICKARNSMTYLLIRNGDKFFRVWTSINVGDHLFPTSDETDAIFRILSQDERYFERRDKESLQYMYARNAMMLQGLLDRTEVMMPLDHRVNLFDPDTYHDLVNFVRDGEMTLPDGRPPFGDWLANINGKLQAGSRIYFALGGNRASGYTSRKDYIDRFLLYHNEWAVPPLPKWGVYQLSLTNEKYPDYDYVPSGETYMCPFDNVEKEELKRVEVRRRLLRIKYNPKDEVGISGWEYNPHTRKNNVSFLVYPTKDKFIINIDQVDKADIEFYLNNRVDRKNYLDMIPLLWGLMDWIASEEEKENDFVRLVAHRKGVPKRLVWDCVDWWKFKNKWKRSVRDDDPKALRMIEKRIDRKQKDFDQSFSQLGE